ncbi:hypothetical protein FQR65_LT01458 [Abscondita terminalis]|nr:hypothetical protein FQR65_LT01458 [Abscondita terminalis]
MFLKFAVVILFVALVTANTKRDDVQAEAATRLERQAGAITMTPSTSVHIQGIKVPSDGTPIFQCIQIINHLY